jgi:uncharacterized protein (DUF58 family)
VGPTLTRTTLTARGAGVLAGGLGVLLFAFYTANLLIFLVAVFLLGFVLAELISFGVTTQGFGPESFSADRVECSSFVGVGGTGLASVRLTSRLPGSFYAEVYDSYPERLTRLHGDSRLLTWWAAGETLSLAYVVSPRIRGLFDLGPTVVTAHDTLGFAFKAVALDSPWQIEAIPLPSSQGLGHPDRLSSTVLGQTWVSARGAGTDFRGLRDYEPGDELRSIAWTRSAQGKLYVREYERESQQDLLVLVDVGREMAIGLQYEDALERSIQAAAAVLRLSFDEGGRSGVMLFASRVLAFEPADRGSTHEFRVFRTLTGAQIGSEASALEVALGQLAGRLHRPTSLLVFSSLGGNPAQFASACGALRQAGHRLYVLAPQERSMYPTLSDPARRTAFGLLIDAEAVRIDTAAEALASAGASVGRFGRDGIVDAVNQLYARGRFRPELT